jgi:drug/metabolite transporter (DMT)-like permease
MTPALYLLAVVQILSAVVGQVSFKQSAGRVIDAMGDVGILELLWGLATDIRVLSGFFLAGMGSLMWFYLLTRAEISFLYPLEHAITYVLLIFAGWYLFGEAIPPFRFAGIIVILAGVCLVLYDQ